MTIASINFVQEINAILAVTDSAVRQALDEDEQYRKVLSKVINNDFAKLYCNEDPEIKDYFHIRDRLNVINGLLMYTYEDRIPRLVIPKPLRKQIIENFHAANQGASSMLARARQDVYWPGLDKDTNVHTATCSQNHRNIRSNRR